MSAINLNARAAASAAPARELPARRPAVELEALAEAGSAELAAAATANGREATAAEVVAWVARNFGADSVAVACSMADAVLPEIVSKQLPGVDVLFLDTGYHFAETYETRDAVAAALPVTVVDVLPLTTVPEQDALHGAELFARDPNACCAMRKVEPLQRSLGGYELWFTGVRRDEAPTRANTPLVTWDERNGLVKVNPVAAWSYDELMDYATLNHVPVNVLLSQGYPSIGCAPCTQPVAAGADPRSGRWATLEKTECGLHL
ncbi:MULTISPECIES: phosphoadenylyl-sulfate reductase [unclassified Cryobacterium]|uniref:phosphoadenylyl-sulfate reductase n=1 Tax=unclassified Cryobacterium TaxID=2649013 RepID=UPI00106BDABE|nr:MULTISPECIES: phosphoadenylyl-sulfate reductase [unclassified Cryobacterium]TFD09487.1 phosphoadenylyl-sulfate reductase [Cryobacterium sp. TMT1-66-1]TFD11786.1 phosphoadenylyl-sulfate reductase [Cryobacterium sp. TMT1-2-2]